MAGLTGGPMLKAALLALVMCALSCSRADADPPARRALVLPEPKMVMREASEVAPLTAELRAKGFDECNPHDPLGLGPYAPFVRVPLGRMLIPQKGGHTPDMGYDVLVHFHGADPVRKLLVQVTRGLVLVLVDRGVGGGPYARAVGSPDAFPILRRAIEDGLRQHTGNKAAHIRHLAVSSWSAGYAAVSKIIEQRQPDIDAVIVLDGLHGQWRYGARHEPDPSALDPNCLKDELALARRAMKGETVFVLTHSRVDPYTYPATSTTAALLLRQLGLRPTPLTAAKTDRFGQTSTVDVEGLHVWGYGGNERLGHCKQLFIMPRIVSELLEPAWDTPAMDRSVPSKPLHPWKRAKRRAPKR
jgi:hypothetical protein